MDKSGPNTNNYRDDVEYSSVEELLKIIRLLNDQSIKSIDSQTYLCIKKLSELGYIESFRWLGDCYYYGLGCEKNAQKANHSYFEAVLFNNDEYSRQKLQIITPELKEYRGNVSLKTMMNRLIFGGVDNKYYCSDDIRVKIAELILDGKIKEYAPATGYFLLWKVCHHKFDYYGDGIAQYRLGECLLNGYGTEKNAVMALEILDDASFSIEETIKRLEDKNIRADQWEELCECFHEEYNFYEILEVVNSMIDEARGKVWKIREENSFGYLYEGCEDEEDVWLKWENQDIVKIERK